MGSNWDEISLYDSHCAERRVKGFYRAVYILVAVVVVVIVVVDTSQAHEPRDPRARSL